MKVTQITVEAGRTFNHPYESYGNLRPALSITAQLEEGDDWEACTRQLQAQAEAQIEMHKLAMLQTMRQARDLKYENLETFYGTETSQSAQAQAIAREILTVAAVCKILQTQREGISALVRSNPQIAEALGGGEPVEASLPW